MNLQGLKIILASFISQHVIFSLAINGNEISTDVKDRSSLHHLESSVKALRRHVRHLRRHFQRQRGIKGFVRPEENKCGNSFKSAIEYIQNYICDVQYIQLREGALLQSLATKSAISVEKKSKSSKVGPKEFMKIEFELRDLASEMRKYAKAAKMKDIPNYSVGLGPKTTTAVPGKMLSNAEGNRDTYKKLITIEECLQCMQRTLLRTKGQKLTTKQ